MAVLAKITVLTAPEKRGKPIEDVFLSILFFRYWDHDQALVSLAIHRSHSQDHVVFGFGEVDFGFSCSPGVLFGKVPIGSLPPEDFINSRHLTPLPLGLGDNLLLTVSVADS